MKQATNKWMETDEKQRFFIFIHFWTSPGTRDTFGCAYMDSGGSLEALREIMGHADIKTTEIYAKVSQRAIFADAQRVFRVLAQKRTETRTGELLAGVM